MVAFRPMAEPHISGLDTVMVGMDNILQTEGSKFSSAMPIQSVTFEYYSGQQRSTNWCSVFEYNNKTNASTTKQFQ